MHSLWLSVCVCVLIGSSEFSRAVLPCSCCYVGVCTMCCVCAMHLLSGCVCIVLRVATVGRI